MANWNICDAASPGMNGGVYNLPYVEAVEGKRHAYLVEHRSAVSDRVYRYVRWTRDPAHPPDPLCPECHPPTQPPEREPAVHVPDERLERYRRIMNLARRVERIGNQRSNRGDYAGANRAWTRADRIKSEAQTLRVPGRNGK